MEWAFPDDVTRPQAEFFVVERHVGVGETGKTTPSIVAGLQTQNL